MTRRTAAPDIAACILALFSATFFFGVLRAAYGTTALRPPGLAAALYAALVALGAALTRGVVLRRPPALPLSVLAFLAVFAGSLVPGAYPETAQLPAGLLALLGAGLLIGGRREFAP